MDTDIASRIERLHAALGRVVETDFRHLTPKIIDQPGFRTILQDFSGGQSQAQLSEALHALIASAGSFHDHLKHWGRKNGISGESIHNYFEQSTDFCIVYDLWNRDKHGGAPRDGGWSKKSPRLLSVRRSMQIETGPEPNSTAQFGVGRNLEPVVSGNGNAFTVLTGEVVDKLGNGLGHAHEIVDRSVRVCESALRRFGVTRLGLSK